ncbi:TPA: hypothetical protein HA251_04875 [Candidatus Woesearchaeota archaeon]|nr:hypothetical protein [Candidatus Woesearchaeota archaeon]
MTDTSDPELRAVYESLVETEKAIAEMIRIEVTTSFSAEKDLPEEIEKNKKEIQDHNHDIAELAKSSTEEMLKESMKLLSERWFALEVNFKSSDGTVLLPESLRGTAVLFSNKGPATNPIPLKHLPVVLSDEMKGIPYDEFTAGKLEIVLDEKMPFVIDRCDIEGTTGSTPLILSPPGKHATVSIVPKEELAKPYSAGTFGKYVITFHLVPMKPGDTSVSLPDDTKEKEAIKAVDEVADKAAETQSAAWVDKSDPKLLEGEREALEYLLKCLAAPNYADLKSKEPLTTIAHHIELRLAALGDDADPATIDARNQLHPLSWKDFKAELRGLIHEINTRTQDLATRASAGGA